VNARVHGYSSLHGLRALSILLDVGWCLDCEREGVDLAGMRVGGEQF